MMMIGIVSVLIYFTLLCGLLSVYYAGRGDPARCNGVLCPESTVEGVMREISTFTGCTSPLELEEG